MSETKTFQEVVQDALSAAPELTAVTLPKGKPLPVESDIYRQIKAHKKDDKLTERFKVIDLSFLSMRLPAARSYMGTLPRFATVPLFGKEPKMVVDVDRSDPLTEIRSKLPASVHAAYKADSRTLNRYDRCVYTPRMLLPEKTKHRIATALYSFHKTSLFLISETTEKEWRKTPIIEVDPLIIGVSPHSGTAFLIDVFDPTPTEQYIAREFLQ